MVTKEHTIKVVDEKTGLMECLVCGEKYHTTMKAGRMGSSCPRTGNVSTSAG